MSTLTKERLEQLANFRGAPVTRQEEQELARIALASLEAEAVEWRVTFRLNGQSGSDFEKTFENQSKMNEIISLHERAGFSASITPFYTAPPALVSVPDEATPENIEILASTFAPRGVTYQWDRDECNAAADSWNAFRAAMLQGAEQTNYRAIVERIAEIIHGKVTDIDLLTVTVKSMKDKLQK